MDLIFKGFRDDIQKFVEEIIYPVVRQRQHETDGHYFRFTDDKGDYRSRKKDNIYVRRIRGYFPGSYYKVDFYADKYKGEVYEMTVMDIMEVGEDLENLRKNLFAVKAAILHGELEPEDADDALSVIVKNMGELATKLQNVRLVDVTDEVEAE